MMPGPFRLYPVAQHFWSLNDYGAVLAVMQRLRPRKVLEFGPGSSTLALIEGGAERVDCCEDSPHWADVHAGRLVERFPKIVAIFSYQWSDPVSVFCVNMETYDMGLIDGPADAWRRRAVLEYCLQRCRHVLVPLECNGGSTFMHDVCREVARQTKRSLEMFATGPDAGAFALIGPPEC